MLYLNLTGFNSENLHHADEYENMYIRYFNKIFAIDDKKEDKSRY